MDIFKEEITDFLSAHVDTQHIVLEVPPDPKMGDYAFACFSLAKVLQKSPQQISKDLEQHFEPTKHVVRATSVGPYLNFFIDWSVRAKQVMRDILKKDMSYGSSNKGKGKKICIEHTSINPNASPHVGRARNALIGDAIVRILRFQKFNVETHYFVNDVGKQIALLVLGSEKKKNVTFDELLSLYIEINKKLEKNPELEKQAFELLSKLENGNKTVRGRFKKIVDTCIKGQEKLFKELGIEYDFFDYESEYLWNKQTETARLRLEKTGKLFVDGHNRWVMDLAGYGLGMKVPVFVLTRGDGTSLYGLRDIAYTIEKLKRGDNILVLGEDQKLYFEQISAVMKELKLTPPRVLHYSFVLLKEGKMSTRKGTVVLLEDFMKEAVKKASVEIKSRHGKSSTATAKAIGYGALKYAILKVSPEKSVTFDWTSALSFEGDTSPYIQYAYARIQSIILKSKVNDLKGYKASKLVESEEAVIVRELERFVDVVSRATEELRPHLIAHYAYELARLFNEYYHKHTVIVDEKEVLKARLALITCVGIVLRNALELLGIDVVDTM